MRSFNSISDKRAGDDVPGVLLPLPFRACEAGGSDAELVLALRRGHPGAALLLFDRHAEQVARWLQRVLGDERELGFRVASVFTRVLSGRTEIAEGSNLTHLVLSATVKEARKALAFRRTISALRRLWGGRSAAEAARVVLGPLGGPEERLYQALDRLPRDVRLTFCLNVMADLPIAQIADACGWSRARTRARLAVAMRTMDHHVGAVCPQATPG